MSAHSNSMCKKIQFQGLSSPLRAEEEAMLLHKQGIVTVLGSDCNRDRAAATISLRRTLSADMSSKKWLSKNALSSSHDSLSSSEGEGEEEEEEMKDVEESEEAEQERFKIWCTIQRDKKEQKKKHDENLASAPAPARFDTWSSILFDKAKEETSSLVTPYIHPSLVKRSKSSLSEKSLEICTESLGSETGSDHVLSSNSKSSPSETEDSEDDDKEQQQQQQQQQQHVMSVQVMQELEEEELLQQVPKHNHVSVKKSMPRCFPPPLPSLHMRSHRDGNGRLFLEAVQVAPQNNKFSAQRRDGRLVLTFASDEEEEEEGGGDEKDQEGELEEEFLGFDEDEEEGKEYEEDENYDEGEEEEDEVVGDVEAVIEKAPLLSSGVITSNFHRLALKMNKPINGVVNRNTKWSEKFNEVIDFEDDASVEEQHGGLVAESLPPRPRVARLIPSATAALASTVATAAASLNAYDCYWGTKHTPKVVASVPEPLLSHHQQNKYSLVKNNDSSSKLIVYGDVNLVVMRGKNGDYLVHNSKSCKDSRRSFLFWEPRCIAT